MDFALIGTIVAFVLTLMVYSYLIGDNPLFKLAEHLLVGVSLGWAVVQIIFGLLVPAFNTIRTEAGNGQPSVGLILTFVVPGVLGLLLLLRPLPALRPFTNIVIAFVIGTVAALALAGAIVGTLIPQIGASMVRLNEGNTGDIIGNVLLLVGAILTLLYFQYTVRKNPDEVAGTGNSAGLIVRLMGRYSLMLAFGAVFATVFVTYFQALIDRLIFLLRAFGS